VPSLPPLASVFGVPTAFLCPPHVKCSTVGGTKAYFPLSPKSFFAPPPRVMPNGFPPLPQTTCPPPYHSRNTFLSPPPLPFPLFSPLRPLHFPLPFHPPHPLPLPLLILSSLFLSPSPRLPSFSTFPPPYISLPYPPSSPTSPPLLPHFSYPYLSRLSLSLSSHSPPPSSPYPFRRSSLSSPLPALSSFFCSPLSLCLLPGVAIFTPRAFGPIPSRQAIFCGMPCQSPSVFPPLFFPV